MSQIVSFINEFLEKTNECILENDRNGDLEYINRVLDELNAFSVSKCCDNFVNIEEVLLKILKLVFPKQHPQLFVKFCHLIFHVATNQQVEWSTLCLHNLVQCLLDALQCGRYWIVPDVLNSLSSILYGNINRVEKFWDDIFGQHGVLVQYIQELRKDFDICVAALKCLQSIFVKRLGENCLSDDHLKQCLSLLLETLQSVLTSIVDVTDVSSAKILCATLRGMENIIISWKLIPIDNLGELLGTVRVLLFYGLKGGLPLMYQCLYPAPIGQFIPQINTETTNVQEKRVTNRKKKNRKKRGNPCKGGKSEVVVDSCSVLDHLDSDYSEDVSSTNSSPLETNSSVVLAAKPAWNCSSSDSEYSDSEMAYTRRIRHTQAKVRYRAYGVLQAVNFSLEKKVMFGFWSSFIPDLPGPSTASQGLTVLMTILKDPSPQVRGAAVAFLADLFLGSKLFLGIAEDSASGRTSFISMSSKLASVIREIHRGLLLAVIAESSPSLITQLLKCFSLLVSNVPYHRLKPGLLTNVMKQIQPFFNHSDVQVQVASFTLLSSIIQINPSTQELVEIVNGSFRSNQHINQFEQLGHFGNTKWLLALCHQNICGTCQEDNVPVSTQVAALHLLTSLLSGYFAHACSEIDAVQKMIFSSLLHFDPSVQLSAAKAFDVLGKCILEENEKNEAAVKTEWVELWSQFLKGPISSCLQSKNSSLRAVGCDCLSNIGGHVFDVLPKELHIMSITLLLGLTKDEDANVCGAAIRCLGVFCLYPCLQEVVIFLMDVGEVVTSLIESSHFATALKASWSLGNLSDALRIKKQYLQQELPVTFVNNLVDTSIKAAQKHNKIQANAVRTLGNILNYLPQSSLGDACTIKLVDSAVKCLLSKLTKTAVKVQWNVCYALATMLQNQDLVTSSVLQLKVVYDSLLFVMERTNNFKVGINCSLALTVLPTRSQYQQFYSRVWSSLLLALKAAERNVDFKELKHRDHLIEQICISLTKLIEIMDIRDVADLESLTALVEEQLKAGYRKLGISGKECNIQSACNHLEGLTTENGLDQKSVNFLNRLIFILKSYSICTSVEEGDGKTEEACVQI